MFRAVIAHASASRVRALARLLRYVRPDLARTPSKVSTCTWLRGLVDHKGVGIGQTDLRELDRAGQMEDLRAAGPPSVSTCKRVVLGDEEAAALAYGHAGEPSELAGGRCPRHQRRARNVPSRPKTTTRWFSAFGNEEL